MKTIFRTFIIAGAVIAATGCGNTGKKAEEQPVAAVETAPTVSVIQVSKRDVPQEATYTSTVRAQPSDM